MSRKEKLVEMMNKFLTSVLSKPIENIKEFTKNNWDPKRLKERGIDDLAKILFHLNQE